MTKLTELCAAQHPPCPLATRPWERARDGRRDSGVGVIRDGPSGGAGRGILRDEGRGRRCGLVGGADQHARPVRDECLGAANPGPWLPPVTRYTLSRNPRSMGIVPRRQLAEDSPLSSAYLPVLPPHTGPVGLGYPRSRSVDYPICNRLVRSRTPVDTVEDVAEVAEVAGSGPAAMMPAQR
jgi:hypothetical protein